MVNEKGAEKGQEEKKRRRAGMRKEMQSSTVLANVSIPSIKVTSVKFVAILTVISHISKALSLALDRVWTILE